MASKSFSILYISFNQYDEIKKYQERPYLYSGTYYIKQIVQYWVIVKRNINLFYGKSRKKIDSFVEASWIVVKFSSKGHIIVNIYTVLEL